MKKERRLVFDLIRFVVDVIAMASGLTLIVIGFGYFAVIGRFLWDELRGAADPASIELPDPELPEVLLQIPVYNEPLVTEQALRCAAQLDWPKDKLHIQLLDDFTDETTVRAARLRSCAPREPTSPMCVGRTARASRRAPAPMASASPTRLSSPCLMLIFVRRRTGSSVACHCW